MPPVSLPTCARHTRAVCILTGMSVDAPPPLPPCTMLHTYAVRALQGGVCRLSCAEYRGQVQMQRQRSTPRACATVSQPSPPPSSPTHSQTPRILVNTQHKLCTTQTHIRMPPCKTQHVFVCAWDTSTQGWTPHIYTGACRYIIATPPTPMARVSHGVGVASDQARAYAATGWRGQRCVSALVQGTALIWI
jgi:hypothetical protein